MVNQVLAAFRRAVSTVILSILRRPWGSGRYGSPRCSHPCVSDSVTSHNSSRGRAAGVRLGGPPDTLPVLAWSDTDDRILVCGRAKTLQWLAVNVTGSSILLRPVHRVELKSSPLWLGWLGENLAIFDADENLRLWGDDYEKPLDLSHIEPVYASAFFKVCIIISIVTSGWPMAMALALNEL